MMSETGEGAVSLIVAYVARGPTKPEVPIPAPNELFVIFSSRVDTGPRMAAVRVGASHIDAESISGINNTGADFYNWLKITGIFYYLYQS